MYRGTFSVEGHTYHFIRITYTNQKEVQDLIDQVHDYSKIDPESFGVKGEDPGMEDWTPGRFVIVNEDMLYTLTEHALLSFQQCADDQVISVEMSPTLLHQELWNAVRNWYATTEIDEWRPVSYVIWHCIKEMIYMRHYCKESDWPEHDCFLTKKYTTCDDCPLVAGKPPYCRYRESLDAIINEEMIAMEELGYVEDEDLVRRLVTKYINQIGEQRGYNQ